jgi:NAD(P)-dependent dehydrogenase (short-subunit alcohol dehydrogenase family)
MIIEDYAMPLEFRSGQALIFGGSGGLGIAIAQAIAARGCGVVLSYQNGQDAAESAAEAIRRSGGQAVARQVFTEDVSSVAAFVAAAAAEGPIHTVVSAAGPHIYLEPLTKTDLGRLRDYVLADILGFATFAQAVTPHLRANRGSITALVTCGVETWLPHDVLSIVPKAGVWALVRGLAAEESRKGMRANAVGVGVVDAGMTVRDKESGAMDERFVESVTNMTPLRRFGRREDIAEAVAFLASDRASFITGQLLNVDGGLAN